MPEAITITEPETPALSPEQETDAKDEALIAESKERGSVKLAGKYESIEELEKGYLELQEKLGSQDSEEEEYEEIVIPSRTELNRMKKNQINELAKDFEFSVKMTDTKAVMIDSFLSQVDEYILQLQESGDFVSATTDDEDGDTDNIKDGGHF